MRSVYAWLHDQRDRIRRLAGNRADRARDSCARGLPRNTRAVRQWSAIGLIFFVWALGPHLMVLGRNTAMVLPGAFLRYIPIVNNARVPGRAMVVVSLAMAVLAAVVAARWRPASGRRPLVLAGLAFCVSS